jgi:DNA-binding GntR family transcriptional regulator
VTAGRIGHLFEMRRLLEPTALVQAAPFVSRVQLDAIREWLAAEIERGGSSEMDTAETDLHIDLLSLCPNREITLAPARTHVLFVPTRYLSDRRRARRASAGHRCLACRQRQQRRAGVAGAFEAGRFAMDAAIRYRQPDDAALSAIEA